MKMDCHPHYLDPATTTRRRKRPRVNNQHPERSTTPTCCSSRRSRPRTATGSSTTPTSATASFLLFFLSVTTTTWTGTTPTTASAEQYSNYAPTEPPVSVNKGVVETQDFCTHNYIQVEKLTLLCDTPGAYYYGSNAYRNSLVCMSGDKAHLKVKCE